MFKKLLISTAISTALLSTPLLAEDSSKGNSMDSGDPQTTGQSRSGPNDAGGQASSDQDTSRSIGTTESDQSKGSDQAGTSAQSPDFDELDRNKDGKLDEDELNRFGSTAAGSTNTKSGEDHGERMLKEYDKDMDGYVSKEEMDKSPKSRSPMNTE